MVVFLDFRILFLESCPRRRDAQALIALLSLCLSWTLRGPSEK